MGLYNRFCMSSLQFCRNINVLCFIGYNHLSEYNSQMPSQQQTFQNYMVSTFALILIGCGGLGAIALFFTAFCMGALGTFCIWHHGADRDRIAHRIFFASSFSKRASRRIKCDRASGLVGGRVWRHTCLASTGPPRYTLRDPRPRGRLDRHRIFHSIT